MTETNINPAHKFWFELLTLGDPSIALVSCFVDGRPSTAICHVRPTEGGEYKVSPLWVSATEDMVITDHDGVATTEG